MFRKLFVAALVAFALRWFPFAAEAQQSRSLDPTLTESYWTEERYVAAIPPDVAYLEPDTKSARENEMWYPPELVVRSASEPQFELPPDMENRLFEPALSATVDPGDDLVSKDAGRAKAHFSSSRLLPLDADLFYPYRAVGKIFFEVPGQGSGVCSAAVIAPRLVLTAGHCVHSGTDAPGFYDNLKFIPSFREGVAPYGAWPATYVITTLTWINGGGTVPNAADYAILELSDLIFPDGKVYRLGDVVGWFGIKTQSLRKNHVHMIGYPVNLDDGVIMHQVAASLRKYSKTSNTTTAGSDMRQGSSGGPWIQNFGLPAVGQQIAGGNLKLDLIVGVTSFVPNAENQKSAGSSVLDSRLIQILNAACENRLGNC